MTIFTDCVFIFGAKYLYLAGGAIALIWFLKLPKEKKKKAVVFGIIVLPTIYIVSRISAWLYFNPRPFTVEHFTPLIPHKPDNGFPSDHVLLLSAIASVIYPFGKKFSLAVWLVAAMVAISRIYVGIHHPIDVIGSAIISIVVSALAYFVLNKFIKNHTPIISKN